MVWPKRCACGHVMSHSVWKKLRCLGIQQGPGDPIELRNCPACGSTLGLRLTKKKAKDSDQTALPCFRG